MRNTIFTMAALACALMGHMAALRAHPITAEEARQNAMAYLSSGEAKHTRGDRQLTLAFTIDQATADSLPLIYTFNIGDHNGFIITSADSQAIPILGYSDSGQFVADSIPVNLREWMDSWAEEIAWQRANGWEAEAPAPPAKAKKTIDCLMKSTWGQNTPFNNHCVFSGKICAAGCVTLAMAQVIYYWATVGKDGKYFRGGCGALPAYLTATERLKVEALSALSAFDWTNMTNSCPKTATSKAAVAQLIRYCGQSIKTNFMEGTSTASTSDVPDALKHLFGYNYGMHFVYAKEMTASKWSETIYEQLAAGKPVIMTGSGNSSHAFVCDGYDVSSGRFHFNWGWAGYCDGWFVMTALNPATYYFNSNKSALIDIQPLSASAYAVVSKDASTLTFYHDTKRSSRTGTIYELNATTKTAPGWNNIATIKKVVFDTSFASYRPTHTFAWMKGLSGLTTLTGLNHLNTEKLTSTAQMFYGCSSLKSIDLSQFSMTGVTDAAYMFYGCSALKSIVMPEDFTHIGQHMFHNCTSLSSVEITDNVSGISDYAFYNCSKLTSVTVHLTSPPAISSGVFTNRKNADLYIPAGFQAAYTNSAYWKEFKNINVFGFAPGDVNHDGIINVADIMATVSNVLGRKDVEFHHKEGDIDADGEINVSDVMNIVGTVLDRSPLGK